MENVARLVIVPMFVLTAVACARTGSTEGAVAVKGPQGRLFVDDGGKGPGLPVVFVHSSAGSTAHWEGQLAHLRNARRAVALDLRGHGKSERPKNRDYAIESMAADVAAVVDGLDLTRFVLVGHSMGGAVAVAYAGEHPTRVAGLFLLDPAADGRQIPKEQAQGLLKGLRSEKYQELIDSHWQTQLKGSKIDVRARLLGELHATPSEVLIGALEGMLTFDPVTALRRYPGPKVSVITALNERPDALQVEVPELPFEKVTGTGHWVQLDAPAWVNTLLDTFLAKLD